MDFYYIDLSPPCRAVMLTAKALGVNMNMKVVNLMAGDHKKPEFTKINPLHTVPTLVDGNFTLWESQAIQTYLVNKYGKQDDSLYPRDPVQRAKVDKMLCFSNGTLFARMAAFIGPVVFGGQKPDPEKKEKLLQAVATFNDLLEGQDYAVGNLITVADHCLVAYMSTIIEDKLFEVEAYPNVAAWMKRCEQNMAGYQAENGVGAKKHGQFLGPKLAI